MNVTVPIEAFKTGVLDPIKHQVLISRVEYYADRAGIAPQFLWTPAVKLTETEVAYYKTCRHGTGKIVGAVYFNYPDIVSRMAMITGAFVRAFLDARLMLVREIMEYAEEDGHIDASILFIPNFYMQHEYGRYEQKKVAALMDVVYSRAVRGQPTIIHIDNKEKAVQIFGDRLSKLLSSDYLMLGDQ